MWSRIGAPGVVLLGTLRTQLSLSQRAVHSSASSLLAPHDSTLKLLCASADSAKVAHSPLQGLMQPVLLICMLWQHPGNCMYCEWSA